MFMLFGEQMLTSSNFTLVAHPSAISQGTLYPSYSSFSRTDVPSSQYNRRIRNTLPNPLMWPSLIEVDRIGLEKPEDLLLVEDEEVIQAFSPHAS
jgi:hypothetical protein